MSNSLSELFKTILTANKILSRKAARDVRKMVNVVGEGDEYEMVSLIVAMAPEGYKQIKEDWRQENFVMAISSMYPLGRKNKQPDFLFPWLFELMQHKNGNIRQAAIRMFEVELESLTQHIHFLDKESNILEVSYQEVDDILFSLYVSINDLMADHWKPEYKRYKYISSLPVGVYKSFQLLLCTLEELCGKEYLEQLQARQIKEA